MGSQSPDQGWNPGPQLWKLRALTKRPWGKSHKFLYLGSLWPCSVGACWWQNDLLHFQAVLSMTLSSFIQWGIQNSRYKKDFQEGTQSRVQAGSRGQWLRAQLAARSSFNPHHFWAGKWGCWQHLPYTVFNKQRRQWGQRGLVGYSLRGGKESDVT